MSSTRFAWKESPGEGTGHSCPWELVFPRPSGMCCSSFTAWDCRGHVLSSRFCSAWQACCLRAEGEQKGGACRARKRGNGPGLFALGALSHGSFPVPFTSRGPGKKVCSCLLPPQRWSSLDGPRPGTKLPPVTSIPDSFGGFCVFPFPSAAVAFCH